MTNIFLAWLISDVHLGRRNYIYNEKYFSGLINHRCDSWWERNWKYFLAWFISDMHLEEEITFIMKNIFLAWLISDVHLRRRNGRQSSWRLVSNCGPLIDCYKRISNTNPKYLQRKYQTWMVLLKVFSFSKPAHNRCKEWCCLRFCRSETEIILAWYS